MRSSGFVNHLYDNIDRTGLHSVLLPLQITEKPLPKNTKNPLPVDLPRSKMSLLKLHNN